MALNRSLINSIKEHFAKKATDELCEIVLVNDLDRWSEEAFAAAREVLAEREAGRAQAPRVPEEETPPPSADERLSYLFSLAAYMVSPVVGAIAFRPGGGDSPVSFGSNVAWLAARTTDTATVAASLDLRRVREARWAAGIAAAHRSGVFVTPPLGGWTLAVGTALLPPARMEVVVKPLVEGLSRRFGDAQYFCAHRPTETHAWARARDGQLLRGYGWFGLRSGAVWNEGAETEQERALHFRFTAGPSEPPRGVGPPSPNEVCVTRLAAMWSVNPKTISEDFREPAKGLLGDIPRQQQPD